MLHGQNAVHPMLAWQDSLGMGAEWALCCTTTVYPHAFYATDPWQVTAGHVRDNQLIENAPTLHPHPTRCKHNPGSSSYCRLRPSRTPSECNSKRVERAKTGTGAPRRGLLLLHEIHALLAHAARALAVGDAPLDAPLLVLAQLRRLRVALVRDRAPLLLVRAAPLPTPVVATGPPQHAVTTVCSSVLQGAVSYLVSKDGKIGGKSTREKVFQGGALDCDFRRASLGMVDMGGSSKARC